MKNIPLFSLCLFLSVLGVPSFVAGQESDDFKVTGVDVQKVFQHFHKTLLTESQVNEERIQIQKTDQELRDEIQLASRALNAEREKYRDVKFSEEEAKAKMEIDSKLLAKYNQLIRNRKGRYDTSNGQLNQKMKQAMTGILAEVQRFIKAHAEERGYFMVLDTSGTSTNQTSPVIGGKGITDITDEVIAGLNKAREGGEGSE